MLGWKNSRKKIETGEMVVEDVLAQMNEEDKAAASVQADAPIVKTESVSASEEEGE